MTPRAETRETDPRCECGHATSDHVDTSVGRPCSRCACADLLHPADSPAPAAGGETTDTSRNALEAIVRRGEDYGTITLGTARDLLARLAASPAGPPRETGLFRCECPMCEHHSTAHAINDASSRAPGAASRDA